MATELGKHQLEALEKLQNGSILCGGVGTGKSRTALTYYFTKVCGGWVPINGIGEMEEFKTPLDLYVITTAKKRDELDWDEDAAKFHIFKGQPELSWGGVKFIVDSWNNIAKYIKVKNAFFIFDEQRVIGSGTWVKSFLKIAKQNRWILLSGTPGDVWTDYIPVFLANQFYSSRQDFYDQHVSFNRFTPYPLIEGFHGVKKLERNRARLLVDMPYERHTTRHEHSVPVLYDKERMQTVWKMRWDPWKEEPIETAASLLYLMRKVCNSDISRMKALLKLMEKHDKLIIFYNFDYELEILRNLGELRRTAEWNGHKHEKIPTGKQWLYLVQYTSGAEGWNCISTDAMVFYSLNYAHRFIEQAMGRIDRMNTRYVDLHYYFLRSSAPIDIAIWRAYKEKRDFTERGFLKSCVKTDFKSDTKNSKVTQN